MKRFHSDDRAISPVIGFALVLAILVSLLGYMQTHFVPVWNAEAESEHFENVYQDLVLFSSEVQSAAISGIPRTSGIRLGFIYPKRGIFYNPKEALFGILTVNPNVNVTVSYTTSINGTTTVSYRSSSLQYELPGNHPFLVYEHGIIIRDFSKFGLLNATGSPNTLIVGDNINIPLLLLNGSGFSDVHIQPDILSIFPIELTSKNNFVKYLTSVNITMDTHYPEVWRFILRNSNTANTNINVIGSNGTGKIYINTTAGNEIDLPDPTQQVIQSGRLYAGMAVEKTVATLQSYTGTGQQSMGMGSVWQDVPPPSKISQIIITNISLITNYSGPSKLNDIIFKVVDLNGHFWFIDIATTYNPPSLPQITGITSTASLSSGSSSGSYIPSTPITFNSATQINLFNKTTSLFSANSNYNDSNMTTPNSLVSVWVGDTSSFKAVNTYIINYQLIIQ